MPPYCRRKYLDLPDLVVQVMLRTGVVARAFIALDHDEYGAEHLVLAMRDGRVERVHHRYIYPHFWLFSYREGEPWRTELPTVEPVKGRLTGRLVDGRTSRSALAHLYGVPLRRIHAAGLQSWLSYRSLGATYTPFLPWLHALGIAFPGPPDLESIPVRDRTG